MKKTPGEKAILAEIRELKKSRKARVQALNRRRKELDRLIENAQSEKARISKQTLDALDANARRIAILEGRLA